MTRNGSTNPSETEASVRGLRRQGVARCGRLLSTIKAPGRQFLLFLVILLYPPRDEVAHLFASRCSLWVGIGYGRVFYRFVSQQPTGK